MWLINLQHMPQLLLPNMDFVVRLVCQRTIIKGHPAGNVAYMQHVCEITLH